MPSMINRTSKFFAFAALVAMSLLGCKASAPPPATPAAEAPAQKVATPLKKPAKPAAPYTVALEDGWKLVNSEPLAGDEPMLIAIYENELDEELTLVGAVIGVNLDDERAESFYEDMREGAHTQENMRVMKERMVKLDGRPAYEVAVVQATDAGLAAAVMVAVQDGKVGYLVRCGGPLEAAKVVVPACAKFVESFRVAK